MSDPVKLKLTKAGLEAALNAEAGGLVIKLDRIQFSTDRFASVNNDPRTTLANVVHESAVAAGGTSIEQNTLRFVAVVNSAMEYDIGAVGIYMDNGVLFAVASVETGSLLRILPNIAFTMSFGMTLTALLLEHIEVVIDTETAKAAALMYLHENQDDPHPQYTAKVGAVKDQLDILDQDLLAFIERYNSTFPKHIVAGVANGGSVEINTSGKIADMRDNRYSIFLTPEGEHEGWSIDRKQNSFSFNIYNRAGTSHAPYAGQVNWSVVQNSADYQIGGNGEYTIAGTYHIPVIAGETKKITLIGGGAGGGGTRYSGGSNYEASDGRSGQDTTITRGVSLLASAKGGKGGTVGIWGNGSSFTNGQAGLGGGFIHNESPENSLIRSIAGVAGHASSRWDRVGGSVSDKGGKGGDGRAGLGDEGWSFGGGGGSGALLEFTYTNSSASLVVLVLVVGEGGLFEVVGQATGENGKTGYAKIETVA